jgi:uracil phosphoribosyltransferase
MTIYELLTYVINPDLVRVDHFYMNRKVNDKNEVIGIDFAGSKVGGNIDDCYLIIADPMGATGNSVNYVLDYYKKMGKPRKIVALHAIITPEYIKNTIPQVIVFAGRLDRGLSSQKILNSPFGQYANERGLNEHQYIIPGAGGIGEVLNNSWV